MAMHSQGGLGCKGTAVEDDTGHRDLVICRMKSLMIFMALF